MTTDVTITPNLGSCTWREHTQRWIAHVNAPSHNGMVMLDGRKPYDVYIGRHFDRNQYFEASIWGNHKHLPLDEYEKYVRDNKCLMAMLPTLRGKVLGCWHWSNELDECHGTVLLKLLAELDGTTFDPEPSPPVTFVENFYAPEETDALFKACSKLEFKRGTAPFGKEKRHATVAFCDMPTRRMQMAGGLFPLEVAPEEIKHLRRRLSDHSGMDVNYFSVVRYIGGDDFMNWHQHREDKVRDDQRVWIVSTGAVRPLAVKRANGGTITKYMATPGSLIVLSSEANETHVHAVPKVKDLIGTRYAVNCKAIPPEKE